MPKFVLIDHSITDLGGHHYEYAVRVLRAAEKAGYDAVLATNRRLGARHTSQGASQPIVPATWRVAPVYRYGFWFEATPSRLMGPVRAVARRALRTAASWKYRWYFSQWGIFWSQRHRGREILRHGLSPRHLLLAALFVALVLYPLRIAAAGAELMAALVPVGNYVRRVGRAAHQVLLAIAWPVKVVAARRKKVAQLAFAWRKRLAFAADSLRLFRKVKLAEGDVVFVPTLAEPEMLGLLKVFERNPATALATWHLLFRRNIFVGREPDYAAQDEGLRPLRNAFQQFRQRTAGLKVSFYTDTEPLTLQYNRLGVATFATAPIPVAANYRVQRSEYRIQQEVGGQRSEAREEIAPPLRVSPSPRLPISVSPQPATRAGATGETASPARPWHIVYIGDARTEKGFHLLPHLVADLAAEGPPVRFTFQSNYNIPGGEPAAAVARAQLDCCPNERVRLLDEPLTSDAYRQLLLSADVVVVPYDRDNYYARSSGIFAEALVAGKPVVVPGGSWMATELSSVLCDYHASLRQSWAQGTGHREQGTGNGEEGTGHRAQGTEKAGGRPCYSLFPVPCSLVESVDVSRLTWTTRDDDQVRAVQGPTLPASSKSPTTCRLEVPAGATHVLFTFRVANHQRGLFASVTAEQFAASDAPTGSHGPGGRRARLTDYDEAADHVAFRSAKVASFNDGTARVSTTAPAFAERKPTMDEDSSADQDALPISLGRTSAIVGGGSDPRGSLLAPLRDGAAQVELGVQTALSNLPLTLDDLGIDFLSAPGGIAAGTIGAAYSEPGDLAGRVREILAHYGHYHATARGFSHRWADYHSPEALVEQLLVRPRAPSHAVTSETKPTGAAAADTRHRLSRVA
ncbi:MAG TPA: glycosyltransferase [Pirellulales bacterium]